MSQDKHTPGPWVAETDSDGALAIWQTTRGCQSSPQRICSITGRDVAEEEEANARLIAAAPDLLAALRDLVDAETMDSPDCALWVRGMERARAAIAKAEGGVS